MLMRKFFITLIATAIFPTLANAELNIRNYDKLKNECEKGDVNACYEVGLGYEFGGSGTLERLPSMAKKYYEKACARENAESCRRIGLFYEENVFNIDARESFLKAINYYDQACDFRSPVGCYQLGDLFKKERNFYRAKHAYLESCNLNNKDACSSLAEMYMEGIGVKKSYAMAKLVYEKGCILEDSKSCFNLGWLYWNGFGATQSKRTAREYFELSCDLGFSDGCSIVRKLDNR